MLWIKHFSKIVLYPSTIRIKTLLFEDNPRNVLLSTLTTNGRTTSTNSFFAFQRLCGSTTASNTRCARKPLSYIMYDYTTVMFRH